MTYKKVTSIFKGTLKIRSEPDADSRLCGSIQYGESLIVETTKVKSKQGTDYYKLAGYGYVIASQMKDAESQTEMDEKVNTAVKKAESAANKAEQAVVWCMAARSVYAPQCDRRDIWFQYLYKLLQFHAGIGRKAGA